MKIEAVLLDVIGTTVKEKDSNTIINCMIKSFKDNDVIADPEFLKANRGRDKMEVISTFIKNKKVPQEYAGLILNSFKENFLNNIHNFVANDYAEDLFLYLRQRNIKIGLGTGLSRDLFENILIHLKWNKKKFDYIGISSEFLNTRPHPDMILDMMNKLSIHELGSFLKVGDTIADIQEGKNANVKTAAIPSGAQSESDLKKEKPDFMLNHLLDLKSIID